MIKKIVKYLVVPAVLFFVWIFFVFLQRSDYGFFSVVQIIDRGVEAPTGPILKGQKISGSFVSQYSNLGLIAVRFDNFGRINQDKVMFKLKREYSNDWQHTVTVNTDQFQPKGLFTFGFEVMPDSRGDKYLFEIESVSGSIDDAVEFYRAYPSVIAVHSYPAHTLKNIPNFVQFAFDKISSQLRDFQNWKSTFIYIQPLVYYLFWLIFHKKRFPVENFKFVSVVILTVIFGINSVVLDSINTSVWIYFLILYSTLALILKLGYIRSFMLGLGVFLLAPVATVFSPKISTVLASFGFIFLVIGFFQLLFAKSVEVNGEPELE